MKDKLVELLTTRWRELGQPWRPRHLLAMVSGGPDSMALLDLLLRSRPAMCADLEVAHINYGLRPEAKEETEMVREWGTARGLKVNILAVRNLKNCKGNLQAEARRLRWEFARHLQQRLGVNNGAVVLGHQADDQVETVLLHMLRGTGLAGLGGMRSCTRIDGLLVWRPLLTVTREQLVAYATAHQVPYKIDKSNAGNAYSRNLLRNRFHAVAKTINPAYHHHFLAVGTKARACHDLLRATVQRRLLRARQDDGYFVIDSEQLKKYHSIERYYWWQAIGDHFGFASRCHASRLRELDRFLFSSAARWTGWETLAAEKSGKRIYIFAQREESCPPPVLVKLCGREELPGWNAHLETKELEQFPVKVPPGTAVFDRKLLRGEWCLRLRQPGDRFRPRGLQGHSQKIKKFLHAQQLPRFLRDRVPLLEDRGRNEIIWVVGYRVAAGTTVQQQPGRYCQVSFIAHGS